MIIILNGSRNSGKTTVGKILSERIPYMANVEVDRLREFVYCLTLEESIPVNLENAVSVVKNLIRRGLHVVLNSPLRKEDIDYLLENLKELEAPIHIFTLRPKLEVALSNRGKREPTADDKLWIAEQYNENSAIRIPELGTVLDNTEKTPSEIADTILQIIKA